MAEYIKPLVDAAISGTVVFLVVVGGLALLLLLVLVRVLSRRDAQRLDEFTKGR